MSEWKEIELGNHADILSSKRIFAADYVSEGIPFYRSKEAIERALGQPISNPLFISKDKYDSIKDKYGAPIDGDILIAAVGERAGIPYLVSGDGDFYFKDGNLIWIRNFTKDLDSTFLLYFLNSRVGQFQLNNMMIGSAQKALTIIGLKGMRIEIPEIEEQKQIAKTLSNLDQKVNLLRQQNQTLEELAQTLFKRWFVDFEFPNEKGQPHKSSGGKMVESELGEIPEEFQVKYLNSFISDSIGGDYGKEEITGDFTEEVTCLRGTDLPDMKTGFPDRAPIRFLKSSKLEKCKLSSGDIVIEISGGTEGQSTGRAMYINDDILSHYSRPMTCVNFCRILRPRNVEFSYFSYLLIDYLYQRGVFFNLENGSTGIKNLDLKTLLNDFELILPNDQLVKQFDLSITGLFTKIQNNNKEIQSLTKLRDTLLPKLISGELKVKELV